MVVPNNASNATAVEPLLRKRLGSEDLDGIEMKKRIHIPTSAELAFSQEKRQDVEGAEKMYEQQDATVHETMRLEWDKRCYFEDGKRQIDYVVAYEEESMCSVLEETDTQTTTDSEEESMENEEKDRRRSTNGKRKVTLTLENGKGHHRHITAAEKRYIRRRNYLNNLKKMGLQLEYRVAQAGNTRYVLIHAPFELLEKQAQLLSVKLPVKRSDVDVQSPTMRLCEYLGLSSLSVNDVHVPHTNYRTPSPLFRSYSTTSWLFRGLERTVLPGVVDRYLERLQIFDFDEKTRKLLNEPEYFTAPYAADRRQQFVNWDRPDLLFPNAERSRMVYDLLIRARYDSGNSNDESHYRVGIERLLSGGAFTSAFPLHQEFRNRLNMLDEDLTQRELLYTKWASWRTFYKYQPLDLVKRYFGSKVALYFAWLGYYTRSLYAAAIVGVLCMVVGFLRVDDDSVSNEICSTDRGVGGLVICPSCIHEHCDFQPLNSSCVYASVSYLFDNTGTVLFAACMSIWATFFLEGWKRYHAEVAWKWGLMDFVVEEDTVRPEFQLQVKTKRFNPISQKEEPYLSIKKKFQNVLASGATVVFFVCLVLAVVFGVMVYRVIAMQMIARYGNDNVDMFAFLIVSITSATLNLMVIMTLNYFYNMLAHWLTRWECPRTQSDFDNQFTFKVFLFQFVNYYSSLFYIAFFKGAFSQVPGRTSFLWGIRLEACDSAGCFAELVIQLAIIMCGKQFFSAFMETLWPKVMSRIRRWQFLIPDEKSKIKEENKEKVLKEGRINRWEADYYLSPVYDQFLFDEYLEMVLQFGFVTLFVAAFPLAPLFAVINNIMEIRLDAYKFLSSMQRPMPAQAKNIGVWLYILDGISKMSVTINAVVIAFTSDFVPRTLWYFEHDMSMKGYVNSTLSYFDVNDLGKNFTNSSFPNTRECRYRAYRTYPCSLGDRSINGQPCDDQYSLTNEWWYIFAFRLLFVVFFEHFVFILKSLIAYLIPDIPTKIFIQQQREKYLARQALLNSSAIIGDANQSSSSPTKHGQDSEDTAYQPGSDFTSRSTTSDPTIVITQGGIPILATESKQLKESKENLRNSVSNESFATCNESNPDLASTKL